MYGGEIQLPADGPGADHLILSDFLLREAVAVECENSSFVAGDIVDGPSKVYALVEIHDGRFIMLGRVELPETFYSAVVVHNAGVRSIHQESGRDICVCPCSHGLPEFRPHLLTDFSCEIEIVMRNLANNVCKKGTAPGEI